MNTSKLFLIPKSKPHFDSRKRVSPKSNKVSVFCRTSSQRLYGTMWATRARSTSWMVDGLWKNEQNYQSSGGSVIEIHLLIVVNGEERERWTSSFSDHSGFDRITCGMVGPLAEEQESEGEVEEEDDVCWGLEKGRDKACRGDGSHRAQGPWIIVVATCSPTSPMSVRPRDSTPQTEGCHRNAPAPPCVPRCRHFPLPSPSSSSCPRHHCHSLMVAVDTSSLRSLNANASTLLSFGSGGGRKLGAWFRRRWLLLLWRRRRRMTLFLLFSKKKFLCVISFWQRLHVTPQVACLHVRLTVT